MSIVYKFRLTKKLYDQVLHTGRGFAVVLNRWDETDYAHLCDYLTQCRKVVPKYVRCLSEHLGESPRAIIRQVLKARFGSCPGRSGDDEAGGRETPSLLYLPEDTVDRNMFLEQLCGASVGRKTFARG